jgi:class 3 adenylate cyclase
VAWIVLVGVVIVVWSVALPAVVAGSLYLGLSFRNFTEFLLLSEGIAVAGILGGAIMAGASLAPVRAWLRGDRSNPAGAQLAAYRAVSVVARNTIVLLMPFHALLDVFIVGPLAHLSTAGVATLVVTTEGVVLVGCDLVLSAFMLLLRPLIEETAASLPPGPPATQAVGIELRMTRAVAGLIFAVGMLTPAVATQFSSRQSRFLAALVATLTIGVYLAALFRSGVILPILWPLRDLTAATRRVARGELDQRVPIASADEFGQLGASFNAMQQGLREREYLQVAFGSYVDPGLAERVLAEGSSLFEGEEIEVTVMFLDIRDFTAFSEATSPKAVVARLNALWELVIPVVTDHGGHANKFVGDGVLAVFGTPLPLADHAEQALAAACGIATAVDDRFGAELRVGIGINSGAVVAGTLGGGGRLEVSVIGDAVNVAARVQELTKETSDRILLTGMTRALLPDTSNGLVPRGTTNIRGKALPIDLYAVSLTTS